MSAVDARFLNVTRGIAEDTIWDDSRCEKLWLYNLHYFDDLNAVGANERVEWHRALIARWIAENPPGRGTGWEPYPTSLRIVNWIKWALAGNELMPDWQHSLAVQVRWLGKRLEYHLLGNHLFANAKALAFAGLFFDGPEADRWFAKGTAILAREVPEQILADGGQFERSPMYHALALEDVLDLLNIQRAYRRDRATGTFEALARKMLDWLRVMSHPDGGVALFNDSAIGIAPELRELEAYAGRLGVGASRSVSPPGGECGGAVASLSRALPVGERQVVSPISSGRGERVRASVLRESGYVRVETRAMVALLDVAPIGPDYLPGHAHADTLSFELSLFGQRVLVNSGTSVYGTGVERARQRGTAAHNTVVVDGEDSSEVWGGFRVARRARPFGLAINEQDGGLVVRCAHDGYRRLTGRPMHWREWRFSGCRVEIEDRLVGGFRDAVAYFHLHPSVICEVLGDNAGVLRLPEGAKLYWRVSGARASVESSSYHPEFGLSLANQRLALVFEGHRVSTVWSWEERIQPDY